MTDDAFSRLLPASAGEGPDGRLTIARCAVADLATATGTPALIIDGELRATAQEYLRAFRSQPLPARNCDVGLLAAAAEGS